MTERAQNADFRRKLPIFADSPLLLEIQAFGGRRKPPKTADFRRKPQIFAENRRKPQIGLRHLRCVTFSSALLRLTALWREPREAPLETEGIGDFHSGKEKHTLWHKIITYEKLFWNNYFWKITNFTRNSWQKSFFPGDFEDAQLLKNNEK